MRVRLSFRWKLFLAFLAACAGVAGVLLEVAWRRSRAGQVQALRSLLTTSASAAAGEIDGDEHAAVRWRPEAVSGPFYKALEEMARRVMASNSRFREVYTISVVDEEPGWGRLALTRERDRARVGDRYEMRRFPAMMRALSAPDADDDLAIDEDGPSLSGYAPVRDRAGKTVAVFGIDIDGSVVHAMRADLLRLVAFGGAGTLLLCAALAFLLASRIHRPVRALTAGVDRVAEGDYTVKVSWPSGDEFERLADRFSAMVGGLEERQRLKQALSLAMEIQQRLLPAKAPEVAGVDLSGASDYCDETGGDYFDYPYVWELPGGKVALTVADVTGHGIGAALLMATARAVLRARAEDGGTPGALLAVVNRHLAHDASRGRFMTCFYGVLDRASGTLAYANAGQAGCWLFRRAKGTFDEMPAGGPPLGVVAGVEFPDARLEGVVPGDVVALATDGVWESRNEAGEQYGMERFLEVVRGAADLDAKGIEAAVLADVERWRGKAPQEDDVTILVAKVTATS
jgi:serine phosphatase RsbU (regulator of sigma subunit)